MLEIVVDRFGVLVDRTTGVEIGPSSVPGLPKQVREAGTHGRSLRDRQCVLPQPEDPGVQVTDDREWSWVCLAVELHHRSEGAVAIACLRIERLVVLQRCDDASERIVRSICHRLERPCDTKKAGPGSGPLCCAHSLFERLIVEFGHRLACLIADVY
jgi:hypothetical protein